MSVGEYEFSAAPSPEDLAKPPMNDIGNARRLILLTGGQVRDDGTVDATRSSLLFLLGVGWVGFNGVFWDREFGEDLARKSAHQVADRLSSLFDQLAERGAPAKDIMRFINDSGSAGKTSAMLRQAQSYLTVKIEVFDRDPMAINCLNGTLKMRWNKDGAEGRRFTFELLPHDPADRITRCADVVYDPKAEAPLYLKTLKASLPAEPERRAFGRMLGYSSTGHIREQAFFFNQGPGQDGKSTLLDACRETLGTYALAVKPETFLEQSNQSGAGPQPDLMAMAGDSRLAIVSEPKRGAKLNEGLLKAWTSGSPISARDLHSRPINFRPVTKLVWEMNSFVVAKGDDDGIWRRIKPVLFRRKVPDSQVDKLLPDKLRLEKPGILNWLIEGVGDWLECDGLAWPETLKAVLDEYRRASSPFGDWLTERCVYGEAAQGERALSRDLYSDYKAWCEDRDNDRVMSSKAFGDAMRDRQIGTAGKNAKGIQYRGPIRLKTLEEIADDIAASNAAAGVGGPVEGAERGPIQFPDGRAAAATTAAGLTSPGVGDGVDSPFIEPEW